VHGVMTRGGAFYSVVGDDFCTLFDTRKREAAHVVFVLSRGSRDKSFGLRAEIQQL
jgi:hypothetical protein